MTQPRLLDNRGQPLSGVPRGVGLSVRVADGKVFIFFGVPVAFIAMEPTHALCLAAAVKDEAAALLKGEPSPLNSVPSWLRPLLVEIRAYLDEMAVYFGEDSEVARALLGQVEEVLKPPAGAAGGPGTAS